MLALAGMRTKATHIVWNLSVFDWRLSVERDEVQPWES
jgi:hypothetical protein